MECVSLQLYTKWPDLTIAQAPRTSWHLNATKKILSMNLALNANSTCHAHRGMPKQFPASPFAHIQAVTGRPSQRERLEGEAIIQVHATSVQLNGWLRELASPLEPEEKKIRRKEVNYIQIPYLGFNS